MKLNIKASLRKSHPCSLPAGSHLSIAFSCAIGAINEKIGHEELYTIEQNEVKMPDRLSAGDVFVCNGDIYTMVNSALAVSYNGINIKPTKNDEISPVRLADDSIVKNGQKVYFFDLCAGSFVVDLVDFRNRQFLLWGYYNGAYIHKAVDRCYSKKQNLFSI